MNLLKRAVTATASIGAALVSTIVVAQSGPPPLTIAGTVQVQGAVQTTNDVVYLPYIKSSQVSLQPGDNADSPRVDFDVPDGKRLVVETITFQASGTGKRLFIEIRQGTGTVNAPMNALYETEDGYQTATHPFKVRIDAIPGSTSELRVRSGFSAPPASLWVGVYGYLVDL